MEKSGPEITLKSEYSGKLKIGEYEIQCAVLNNEKRVFWQREVLGLLTGNTKGGLSRYFKAKNLAKYVPEKFVSNSWDLDIIKFKHNTRTAFGFEAEDLIDICYMYINARNDGALLPNQMHLAEKANIIVKAFAKTGVVALIDEATGYQQVRKREALQAILDKYLRAEFAAWAKTFPDEFYEQIFRLKGWTYNPKSVRRPSVIGKYTNDIVYSRLAPGILKELETKNPILDSGRRKARHHQFLTDDIGHPALSQHLFAVISLMRASKTWEGFYTLLERAFPKDNQQLTFDILLDGKE
jgi:hypothetical protein